MAAGLTLETFLETMVVERGAAAATVEAYRRDLEAWIGFLAKRGRDVETASTEDVAAHLGELEARGFEASTQARHLSALRQFHRFLYDEGLRGDDPTGKIDAPKKRRPLPQVLSEEEDRKSTRLNSSH